MGGSELVLEKVRTGRLPGGGGACVGVVGGRASVPGRGDTGAWDSGKQEKVLGQSEGVV